MLVLLLFVIQLNVSAQTPGDFKSDASGTWTTAGTWLTYDGSSWVAATGMPVAATNIFIEAGHTITVDAVSACKDFNFSTTALLQLGQTFLQLTEN